MSKWYFLTVEKPPVRVLPGCDRVLHNCGGGSSRLNGVHLEHSLPNHFSKNHHVELWQFVRYLVDRFSLPGSLSQDDSENIIKILEEGRNQKVDEMEIEMSRDIATGLSVNGIEGADITFGSKGKTKYVMKVKYKYDG